MVTLTVISYTCICSHWYPPGWPPEPLSSLSRSQLCAQKPTKKRMGSMIWKRWCPPIRLCRQWAGQFSSGSSCFSNENAYVSSKRTSVVRFTDVSHQIGQCYCSLLSRYIYILAQFCLNVLPSMTECSLCQKV